MDEPSGLAEMTMRAKAASFILANANMMQKNQALNEISRALLNHVEEIHNANQQDLSQSNHKNNELIQLEPLDVIVKDIFRIMDLPVLVGDIFDSAELTNGLKITKYCIPLGTIGYVLDEHPSRVMKTAALTIKSSNSLIVWSEKHIQHTSRILIKIIQIALKAADLPMDAVQLVEKNDEDSLQKFVQYKSGLDLLLSSGSSELTKFCTEKSVIPLTYDKPAVCHLYVDQMVNIDKAIDVIVNAKTQDPAANNSISTLLVHRFIAKQLLPLLFKNLRDHNISFRLDSQSWNFFISLRSDIGDSQLAEPNDWDKAWHSNVLNIKLVNNVYEALEHIYVYGTGYCDGILSDHPAVAIVFTSSVDSHVIMINASTRLWDASYMGLETDAASGAQKFHVAGPVDLKELMSYKWLIQGNYHIR